MRSLEDRKKCGRERGRKKGGREGVMYREGLTILSLPRYKERESQSFLKQNFSFPQACEKLSFLLT